GHINDVTLNKIKTQANILNKAKLKKGSMALAVIATVGFAALTAIIGASIISLPFTVGIVCGVLALGFAAFTIYNIVKATKPSLEVKSLRSVYKIGKADPKFFKEEGPSKNQESQHQSSNKPAKQ